LGRRTIRTPRKHEALVDVGEPRLLGLQQQAERLDALPQPREQDACLLLVAVDEHDEVVREAHKPEGRFSLPAQVLALAPVAAHLAPIRLIEPVERRERDVDEQRRGDPALRGARHRPLKHARLPHHARLQERAHEPKHASVPDPPPGLPENEGV
jgi:hypothetical protein